MSVEFEGTWAEEQTNNISEDFTMDTKQKKIQWRGQMYERHTINIKTKFALSGADKTFHFIVMYLIFADIN